MLSEWEVYSSELKERGIFVNRLHDIGIFECCVKNTSKISLDELQSLLESTLFQQFDTDIAQSPLEYDNNERHYFIKLIQNTEKQQHYRHKRQLALQKKLKEQQQKPFEF